MYFLQFGGDFVGPRAIVEGKTHSSCFSEETSVSFTNQLASKESKAQSTVSFNLDSSLIQNITPHTTETCFVDEENVTAISDAQSVFPSTSSRDSVELGTRIVEMSYLLQKLKEVSQHNPAFGCSLVNLHVCKEVRKGLSSIIVCKCDMCLLEFHIPTSDPATDKMDVNTRAVAGIMSIGAGFTQLEDLCATIGIPCMSSKTYSRLHDTVCDGWENAAANEMQAANEEEAAIATAKGEVDEDGVPILTVVADGCWSKRSYRSGKHDALSGVAAIVGFYTRKVLFMAVRNRFCLVCARSKNSADVPQHTCYKNWSGSSSSMEASIIVEGFKQSEEIHKVRYGRLIADGDSSCYKKLLEARPYKHLTIEKIECRNHLLRNYMSKIENVIKSKLGIPTQRKLVAANKLKLRCAVTKAVQHRKSQDLSVHEKISALKQDIENGPNHVFGDHSFCAAYFCTRNKEDKNFVPELRECGLFQEMQAAARYLARHSRSLLVDVDSNSVEQFNSIVAKNVGAKRVNFSLKRSYQGRCAAAVVAHNSKRPHSVLHKTMFNGKSPNKVRKKIDARRKTLASQSASRMNEKRKKNPKVNASKCLLKKYTDKDYGPHCQQPDMSPDEYTQEKSEFLNTLTNLQQNSNCIERETVLQAGSGRWLEMRRKMLTASNFGKVCRMRPTTSCKNIVKNMLYSHVLNVPSLEHGRNSESVALTQLEVQEGITIEKCGLFIDKEYAYLGASPDGLVGDKGIVEIKSPFSAAGMDVDDALCQGKIKYLEANENKEVNVKKTHEYYFQIQGQLHVTEREYCIFAVWTSRDRPLKVVKVIRDDEFWRNNMISKLQKFYMHCLLPELIDPRHTRSMEVRDPEHILSAQKKKEQKPTQVSRV